MFEAVNGGISPPGIIEALPDMKAWPYVVRFNFSHWFYVVCSSITEDYAPISYFIDDVEQLLELNLDENSIIEQAYIVCPKTNQWKMSLIKRISKAAETSLNYEEAVYIYELEDGTQYLSSASSTKNSCLVDVNTLCEFFTVS